MQLTYTDHHIFVRTSDPREQNVLTGWLAAVNVKNGYRLPYHLWSMRELAASFPHLKQSQDFVNRGQDLASKVNRIIELRKNPNPFYKGLRPYQADDMWFLKELPAALIGNEPRTGKTPTAITLMKEIGGKRNLVIAPASLIYNWEKEIGEWHPDLNAVVVTGPLKSRKLIYSSLKDPYTLIISKDTLKSDLPLMKFISQIDVCIVDEAHYLRNWKTAQSKAVCSVKAKRRYAMTGTPTVNGPDDIYGILRFLQPEVYTSFWQFADRYFYLDTNYHTGGKEVGKIKPHREKELQELVGLISVQRKRKEVMPWLPAKQRSTFTLKLDGKQRKLYDEMRKSFVASDGDTVIDTQSVITQLMRLRQLCLDPRLLGFDQVGAKTTALLEYLDSHKSHPVVIMSFFTSYLKLLKPEIEALGLKVGEINGEMSSKQKQDSASYFQSGKFDVLLCNTISAGTGFTLDRGETVIFTDKPFTPAECEQAEDRVCPTTEDKNHKHEILTFTCADTVDERINKILDRKKSLVEFINDGGAAAVRKLMEG